MRPRPSLLYVAAAAADTWLAGHRDPGVRRWRRLTKPALTPLLAWRLHRAPAAPLRTPTLLALAAGGIGDVALLREGRRAFLVGLTSFAAGHVAYLLGWRRLSAGTAMTAAPGPRAAVLAGLLVGPALAHAAARREPVLGVPVAAYAALLASTVAVATHLDDDVPADVRRRLAVGAWTFLASDTLLATRSFVMDEPPAWAERGVMATYATAQWLLSDAARRA